MDDVQEEVSVAEEKLYLVGIDRLEFSGHLLNDLVISRYLRTSFLKERSIDLLLEELTPEAKSCMCCQVLKQLISLKKPNKNLEKQLTSHS